MTKQYWLDKWQHNDIKFNQDDVNVYLQRYYSRFNLSKSELIFVPLCGKSIDMLWLMNKGHHVVGVELSSVACKAFFEDNHLAYQVKTRGSFITYFNDSITLYCGDFFELMPGLMGNIKSVYDRGAFIAFPPDMRGQYVAQLASLIAVGGKIIMNTIEYDERREEGPPYSASFKNIAQLYQSSFHINQLEQSVYEVPEHLKSQGLLTANHAVYLLTKHEKAF